MGVILLPVVGSALTWLSLCVAAVVLGAGRMRWRTPGGRWVFAAGLLGLAGPAIGAGLAVWTIFLPPRNGDDVILIGLAAVLAVLAVASWVLAHIALAGAVRAVAKAHREGVR